MSDKALRQGGNELERLWDGLLSRRPDQVRQAFASLTPGEQAGVLAHLQRMASEPGWHPEQRISAEAALDAIRTTDGQDEHGSIE